jgi:hypothetical protein
MPVAYQRLRLLAARGTLTATISLTGTKIREPLAAIARDHALWVVLISFGSAGFGMAAVRRSR